mmetsp:Transcript_2576/g.5846  ORF Transcript_2576/g.5846 Transcript_2576/m.5846 type:complete len:82 (-) Transcript_2576:376-621(-)
MFFNAWYFNQDISRWNVSNVKYMICMFQGAMRFNQNLCEWPVSVDVRTTMMLTGSDCPVPDFPPYITSAVFPLEAFCQECT